MFRAAEQRMRPMLMTALSACIGFAEGVGIRQAEALKAGSGFAAC
jgi:multidrug efflux pump subunit AcrB